MSVAAAIRGTRIPTALWPLADQGMVSVGGFVVTLTLARGLPPEAYGVYALLFMAMLQIQVVSGSLLLYPLCVRGTVMTPRDQAALFGIGLALMLGMTLPLGAILAAGLFATGYAGLIGPALLWLLFWQLQELLRRGLFTQLRHASAIPGDAIRYGGQAAALLALSSSGTLTLDHAVLGMAVAAGLAAVWQASQVRLSFTALVEWRHVAAGFVRVGAGSLGSNLLSTISLQVYPWVLAGTGGAALAAAFQAGLNVLTVVNPVLIGLGNIIPQAVAREVRHASIRQAWNASRIHMALGAAPVLAFYGVAAAAPEPILAMLYGHGSAYAAMALPVRLMAAAGILGFAVEMVIAFLHGIQRTRLSAAINAAGLGAALLLGLPLMLGLGVAGACLGLLATNAIRVGLASAVLTQLLRDGRVE